MVGTYFAVSCGALNNKEKVFMAFAWMPKATVQAALGPVFLDNCIKYGKEDWKPMGEEILTLAVLSILITAPLGAVCILGMINISSQLSQLYPAFKLKACYNFLFVSGRKCLSRSALGPLLLDDSPPPAPAARSHETVHSHAPEICHEI